MSTRGLAQNAKPSRRRSRCQCDKFESSSNGGSSSHPSTSECENDEHSSQPTKRRIVDIPACHSSVSVIEETEVFSLNKQAMSHYVMGDYQTALSLLEKAMCLIRNKSFYLDIRVQKAQALNEPPPTSSYIYQRTDFDEGLDVYNDVEPVDVSMLPQAVEATLLFNAGQARRRLEDDVGASHLYQLALGVLLSTEMLSLLSNESYTAVSVSQAVHPVVVPLLNNAGHLAYRQGRLQDAIFLYETGLCHARALSGINDLSVGRTLNCLGVVTYHLGADEALRSISLFDQALAILTVILGPESTVVATVQNNLGRAFVQREEFGAAYHQYKLALVIRRNHLGLDHLDTAATSFNAAQSLHQLRDFDRAIVLYKEFLRVATIKFSKEHRDIAVVLSGLAQIHQERKEYDKALELYRESLRVGRAALGEYHSEVSILYNRLGNFLFERERYDHALRAYKRGLRIERRVLDASHPNIAVTLSNIGEIYRQQGSYTRSIKLYSQALKLQKVRHGEESAEVASTMSVIGLIYEQKGELNMSLSFLQDALIIRRAVLGDNHLDVASTLMYLGTLLYRRNMISTSLHLFAEAQRIRAKALGPDDRDVSFSMYNVGLCHQLRGEFKDAVACYRETLRVERLVLGEYHKDVALTYRKLGEALRADGDLDGALQSFKNALRSEQQSVAKEDPAVVARTLNEIGNLHLLLGQVDAMMKAFCDSARVFQEAGLPVDSVSVSPSLKLYAAGFDKAAAAA